MIALLLAVVLGLSQDAVIPKMEHAQDVVGTPNRVKRDYKLSRGGKLDSEVTADINFRTGKYIIHGSGTCATVVKRSLDPEMVIAMSEQKSRAVAVTRENYTFTALGESALDGESYFLFQMTPKRKQGELISGQVWIDKKSFLIRRTEGVMRPPSIWVKTVQVQLDFGPQVWVMTNMEAVADIRFMGKWKLTEHTLSSGDVGGVK
jgi:hypothetical protein